MSFSCMHVTLTAGSFMADLSNSIFDLHEADKQARTMYLLQQKNPSTGKTWTRAEIDELPSSYWNDYCRRTIPGPDVLCSRMQACYDKHANDIDAKGTLLFTEKTSTVHKRQMELISKGYLSGNKCTA